jgi:hypothetical protein
MCSVSLPGCIAHFFQSSSKHPHNGTLTSHQLWFGGGISSSKIATTMVDQALSTTTGRLTSLRRESKWKSAHKSSLLFTFTSLILDTSPKLFWLNLRVNFKRALFYFYSVQSAKNPCSQFSYDGYRSSVERDREREKERDGKLGQKQDFYRGQAKSCTEIGRTEFRACLLVGKGRDGQEETAFQMQSPTSACSGSMQCPCDSLPGWISCCIRFYSP